MSRLALILDNEEKGLIDPNDFYDSYKVYLTYEAELRKRLSDIVREIYMALKSKNKSIANIESEFKQNS